LAVSTSLTASLTLSVRFRVYTSWMSIDPWFLPRMFFHFGHSNSPLSHPTLTWRAFLSREQSPSFVEAFHNRLTPYESFLWILGMSRPFVKFRNVISQISDGEDARLAAVRAKILVLAGEQDMLMRLPIMEDLASSYRVAWADGKKPLKDVGAEIVPVDGEGGRDTEGLGVRFCMVPKAGHHLQNDITWEVGAKKLLEFYEQL
jgi:pimeloyl-ACP methyl ester carboxylesterase